MRSCGPRTSYECVHAAGSPLFASHHGSAGSRPIALAMRSQRGGGGGGGAGRGSSGGGEASCKTSATSASTTSRMKRWPPWSTWQPSQEMEAVSSASIIAWYRSTKRQPIFPASSRRLAGSCRLMTSAEKSYAPSLHSGGGEMRRTRLIGTSGKVSTSAAICRWKSAPSKPRRPSLVPSLCGKQGRRATARASCQLAEVGRGWGGRPEFDLVLTERVLEGKLAETAGWLFFFHIAPSMIANTSGRVVTARPQTSLPW